MEEIEYLEEYEDFILPNATGCTENLPASRTSVDSLEGLYKDLIGDSPTPAAERTNTSQYTVKPVGGAIKASLFNTADVGLLSKQTHITKCKVDSGSSGYFNISDIQNQSYKSQSQSISLINRVASKCFSTVPSLQRTDKLKCVATVKPTLQRVNNPSNRYLPNSSSPLKNDTLVRSFPLVSATVSTEPKNTIGPKVPGNVSNTNLKNQNISKTSNPYHGSGMDPLSLDDHDAFLDFDADKNGSVDDFDFESDLDNSITAGLSDMDSDSVDLSEDYSDGNFDFSDLSSEASDVRRGILFKRKKLPKSNLQENTETSKSKPGAAYKKPEFRKDQTDLSNNKCTPNFKFKPNQQHASYKAIGTEKKPINPSFGERKIHETVRKPQFIETKECSSKSLPSTNKEMLLNGKTSMLSKLLNDSNECVVKTLNAGTNSKQTAIVPAAKKIIIVKKEESPKNSNLKAGIVTTKPEIHSSEKHETNKAHANGNIIHNKDDSLNPMSVEPALEESLVKKISLEPKLNKSLSSPHNIEQSATKGVDTPYKSVRTKLGSLYLKSIKPPVNKVLMAKKISPKNNVVSAQQESELRNNKPLVKPQPVEKPIDEEQIRDKHILQKASPEKRPCEEKTSLSNTQKKDIAQIKSHITHKDDGLNQKGNDFESSNDKCKRYSLKSRINHSNSFKKELSGNSVEKTVTQDQNQIKEKKQTVQSTKSSVDKPLKSITKESNSLKESISKPKENTNDKETSAMQCKFTPRTFNIRLNKNIVDQLTRSSTSCIESKGPSAEKTVEHGSENILKRKLPACPNVDTSCGNTLPETGKNKLHKHQDFSPETNDTSKKSKLSTTTSPKEIQTEIHTKDTESTNKSTCPASRKRKRRKMKMNGTSKVLRSSLKTLPQVSDLSNPEILNSEAAANDSSLQAKEGSIQSSPKVSNGVVSQNELSPANNSIRTERRKLRKGRGRLLKQTKKENTLADESKDMSESNNAPGLSVLTPLIDNTCNGEEERTPIETAAVLTDECMCIDNIGPSVSERTNLNMNPEAAIIQLKAEVYGDTLITQYQPELTSRNNTYSSLRPYESSEPFNGTRYSDSRNESEFTVFELPSFIVMKTKLITRKDLNCNKSYIPPLVKQKIDKLAEGRQAVPIFKSERPEFKDVCLEINALLGRNANYLKFASGSERQTRMNQVLGDSSLSVDDAQCALKFLQSYLSFRTKDATTTTKSKSQQFIPIYDSQKKIIGYRKRTTHSKKSHSNDSVRRIATSRVPNVNAPASLVPSITISDTRNLRTVPATSSAEKVLEFPTKVEPQLMDVGDEEIIVPDSAPPAEPCIKSEAESTK